MRDWFLPVAPVAVIAYFIAFPDHLTVFALIFGWVNRVAH